MSVTGRQGNGPPGLDESRQARDPVPGEATKNLPGGSLLVTGRKSHPLPPATPGRS